MARSAGMDPQPSSRIWSFAGCVLDERTLELKVGGMLVDLERKPLEVLLHLLRHAGEVVTKDELAEAVWPGRITTDSNLTKTMAVLRAGLGEPGQAAIKTVHGYGYRLIAPVSVQTPAMDPGPARFDFKPGESPPLRPLWRLESRLGTGGHGEVWLARHSGTKESRVFKFADEGNALSALKREITLNRLLRETLPAREDFLQLLDWNIEEPPFFIESEHVAAGNLACWAESRGGLAAIPLGQRLALVASVAEAVAAAHSVGVLHKDLKPGNVLVCQPERSEGPPRIKLADFGSGSLIDPAALEVHGIAQMGFTQTVRVGSDTSGTPLYLAPEVLTGQPFTVQSDIYALGVMLYQLAAGDLRKALAPGWEKDVADELLREDIGAAAAGSPVDRLGDAAALAHRLCTLEERRRARGQARAEQEQLARAQHMRGQVRRLRLVAGVLFVATGAAVAGGVVAWRARLAVEQAAATTAAVNRFLNKDLLASADPRQGPTRDLTVRGMLDRAAESVDRRFADQPAAAAEVHATLGQAYLQLGEFDASRRHLERAIELFQSVEGPSGLAALESHLRLGSVMDGQGQLREACALATQLSAQFRDLSIEDERGLSVRLGDVRCRLRNAVGPDPALDELGALVREVEAQGGTERAAYASALSTLAIAQFDREDYPGAEHGRRKLDAYYTRVLGPDHITTVRNRALWSGALTYSGRLDEAEGQLRSAHESLERWAGPGSSETEWLRIWELGLRLEQGRSEECERLARLVLTTPVGQQRRGTFRLSAVFYLSEALARQGKLAEAATAFDETLRMNREFGLDKAWYEIPTRAMWADVLLRQGRTADAAAMLASITSEDLAKTHPRHWRRALFRRSEGLVWLKQGKAAEGRAALRESLEIYETVYGPDHWRTKRAISELNSLSPRA